jgi:hypothetical protein
VIWKIYLAAQEATLVTFGLWWVNAQFGSVPKSILLVLLTVEWLAKFFAALGAR